MSTPITDAGERVVGALRVEDDRAEVDARTRSTLAIILLAGLAALAIAWVLARRLATNLSSPIERLARAAADLDHDLSRSELPRSGIGEIDALADALTASSTRINDALARERRFSADVSHQLRTPLAAIRLRLERRQITHEAARLAESTLDDLDRLDATVTHLLAFARDATPRGAETALAQIMQDSQQRWEVHPHDGRRIHWRIDGDQPVSVADSAIDQVLDVLIDNALRHGRGDVTITTRGVRGGVAVDVSDAGAVEASVTEERLFRRGHGHGHGIGLALARSIAEADGGRLLLTRRDPTRFTLFLPASPPTA